MAAVTIDSVQVDLNSDVGESYGAWRMGEDDALIPLVTSVNVACGAHAGDPLVMTRTVRLARAAGVGVGAHPGYPDRDGFGRRHLPMTTDELTASLLAQLGALAAIAHAEGAELRHVKPHGALYNAAAADPALAEVVGRAVLRFSREMVVVGLAGSVGLGAIAALGVATAAEAFADRLYESDGSLRSRTHPDAVHHDPAVAAAQAVGITRDGAVIAADGARVALRADTICIHGDTPGAAGIAAAVRRALEAAGVAVQRLGR